MTDALSSRLLEAIQKTEKAAHLTDADLIPRLCQAHRDIVEMYMATDGRPKPGRFRDLDHASAMGRKTALGLALMALARAYKVEEN